MHDHDFKLDLDGQVTCAICGSMDDEREPNGFLCSNAWTRNDTIDQ